MDGWEDEWVDRQVNRQMDGNPADGFKGRAHRKLLDFLGINLIPSS